MTERVAAVTALVAVVILMALLATPPTGRIWKRYRAADPVTQIAGPMVAGALLAVALFATLIWVMTVFGWVPPRGDGT